MKKLKVGVVGVGHIGQHHARILSQLPEAELVGITDVNLQAATQVAERVGTRVLPDTHSLAKEVDAVCVAVPTIYHRACARVFLEQGVATLVEKPLALSIEDAAEMVHLAKQSGTILQVGHSERYNPAWLATETAGIRPSFVEARRLSPFPFRSLDVSVVLDVMIHDIDLVLSLIDSPVRSVRSSGSRVLGASTDWAQAHLLFADGSEAQLVASRVHPDSVRSMGVWSQDESMEIDFLHRQTTISTLSPEMSNRQYDGTEKLTPDERKELQQRLFSVQKQSHDKTVEPLRLELTDFLHSVRHQTPAKVSGEAGLAAVRVALQIEEGIGQMQSTVPLRKIA